MKRSRPSEPDPNGGPPRRGCLYMARFALLALALFWLALWFAFPDKPARRKVAMLAGLSVPFLIVAGVPLGNLADRLELRRYCRSRGFKILRYRWRGVVYMDGDVQRYSRWPDDFQTPGASPS